MPQSKISVGIVGGTGYTGCELLRLLIPHPVFEVSVVTARQQAGLKVSHHWPQLETLTELEFVEPDVGRLATCDLVFCATPHATAMTLVPALLEEGVRVVDLSADFRLRNIGTWERWYGVAHTAPEWVERAVYGLPEWQPDRIATARLVANPGCYPTATVLPLLPLVESGMLNGQQLIVDAKSGVSGAGRKASESLLFGHVAENFKPYGLAGHRHQPEIAQTLADAGAALEGLVFVPHLLPMFRGMEVTTYFRTDASAARMRALADAWFEGKPFLHRTEGHSVPEVASVRTSNLLRCNYFDDGAGTAIVVSVIDNLNKGAAGQAVQNANLMFGLPEDDGLNLIPASP